MREEKTFIAPIDQRTDEDSNGYSKYNHPKRYWQKLSNYWGYAVGAFFALLLILYFRNASTSSLTQLKLATWNIAAINNNPFEYWVTYEGADGKKYDKLMLDVEKFVENPGEKDVPVSSVFTDDMYKILRDRMEKHGWTGLDKVDEYWTGTYRDRKIVTGFLKDKMIGLKRLASMPDRVTNTINLDDGSQVYRPTPINMYEGDLSTLDKWFAQWMEFMFDTKVTVKGGSPKPVCDLLGPINRAKYKDVTEEEEKVSIPLQTVLGAVFDSILVHMLNTVAPDDWQNIKRTLGEKLTKGKLDRTVEILVNQYSDRDIIFLQEVSAIFVDKYQASALSSLFDVNVPAKLDGKRDQNSMILTRKGLFTKGNEVTQTVLDAAKEPIGCGDGDLFAQTMTLGEDSYLLASFHGDTNGLQTVPVITAMNTAVQSNFPNHKVIFGMDANVYEKPSKKTQLCMEFVDEYKKLGYDSCFGDNVDPTSHTTFNARTYMQAQLNKACKSNEKKECGDVNPKDFVLFYPHDFTPGTTGKDNTGHGEYIDQPFPTLTFPSDHGVLFTTINIVGA